MRDIDDKKKVIEALNDVPTIRYAVSKTQIPRQTIYRWMKSSKKFKDQVLKAKRQGVADINDVAISQIIRNVQDNKPWATKYWLEHNHARYKPEKADKSKPDINIQINNTKKMNDDDGPIRVVDALKREFNLGKQISEINIEELRTEVYNRRVKRNMVPEGVADEMLVGMIFSKKMKQEGITSPPQISPSDTDLLSS